MGAAPPPRTTGPVDGRQKNMCSEKNHFLTGDGLIFGIDFWKGERGFVCGGGVVSRGLTPPRSFVLGESQWLGKGCFWLSQWGKLGENCPFFFSKSISNVAINCFGCGTTVREKGSESRQVDGNGRGNDWVHVSEIFRFPFAYQKRWVIGGWV